MKKQMILAALILAQVVSSVSSANTFNKDGVSTGSMRISTQGMAFVGTVMTYSSGQNQTAVAVGWVLIVLGELAQGGDIALGAELYNEGSDVGVYGENQAGENTQAHANVKKILQNTEMEALMAVNNPQLSSGLVVGEFAKSLNVNPQRLGQLVVVGKDFATAKLNGAQFSDKRISVSKAEVMASAGPLSESELKVISNYLNLRNITVL